MRETKGFEPKENLNNPEKEKLLLNPSFQRLATGFELYQNYYSECADEQQRKIIYDRMHTIYNEQDIFKEKIDEDSSKSISKKKRKIFKNLTSSDKAELTEAILHDCETGNFTREKFADFITNSPPDSREKIFYVFFPHDGQQYYDVEGVFDVNNVFSIFQDDDDPDKLEIDILPSQFNNMEEYLRKIIEGFCYLAKAFKQSLPKFSKIKEVSMSSWLFSPEYKKFYDLLFDDKLEFLGVNLNDNPLQNSVQNFAMIYNNKLLRNYLIDGLKPNFYETVITRENIEKLFGDKGHVMKKLREFFKEYSKLKK